MEPLGDVLLPVPAPAPLVEGQLHSLDLPPLLPPDSTLLPPDLPPDFPPDLPKRENLFLDPTEAQEVTLCVCQSVLDI